MTKEKTKNPTLRIMPGRNLIFVLCIFCVLSFTAFWWDGTFNIMVNAMIIIVAVSAYDLIKISAADNHIITSLNIPTKAGRGLEFNLEISITNHLERNITVDCRTIIPPVAGSDLRADHIKIKSEYIETITYPLEISQRGKYTIGETWIRISGPLNFIDLQWNAAAADDIMIYPESIITNNEFIDHLGSRQTEKIKHFQRRGEGMEFDTVTNFKPGDDIRHIDWRSSARHRSLLVKRHTIEQHREVIILLDCGRLMGSDTGNGTKLDRGVDSALMLSEVALNRGDRCGFGVFDDRIITYLPPQGGNRARKIILNSVYDVRSEFRESNFAEIFAMLQSKQRKRSLVIIISDLTDGDTSIKFRSAMLSLSQRHMVVFAALRTPLLNQYATDAVENYQQLCQKALALRLERQREDTLHKLSHSGVRVLDVHPNELTVPLINEYLYLRESNLV